MYTRPVFDERDAAILAANIAAWDAIEGPRVGDWCRMPDGEMRRFTHAWDDGLQTTHNRIGGLGSFYFGCGYMSYSGCLDDVVKHERIFPTDEIKPAAGWFFHHNQAGAHKGVYCNMPCRVFEVRS
jgi:hypothetical protein